MSISRKPHQRRAASDSVKALRADRRTQCIAPCGSGKTNIGVYTAQDIKAQRVLVVVPSLALLRQTIEAWMIAGDWQEIKRLAVCSDESAGYDEIPFCAGDLPAGVTGDPIELKKFLRKPVHQGSLLIVFSTYQSLHVVEAAFGRDTPDFDLAVLDEAHTAATTADSRYATVLYDDRIPCRNRLFLTATPKHYDYPAITSLPANQQPLSMDNPSLFGRVGYHLSFSEAVERNLICDYRVLVSTCGQEEVATAIEEGARVKGSKSRISARSAASAVALAQGIKESGAKKVITFHSTVDDAKSFQRTWKHWLETKFEGFKVFHVSGEMSAKERAAVMTQFAEAEKAVITNARCLGVGVDVPSVDMVAFLSPRRGFIDIVQNVGRALRLSPGKKVGFVLVPVFLDDGDETKTAPFAELFAVMRHMKHSDEMLANRIRVAAQEWGENGQTECDFGKIEYVGSGPTLERIKRSITTRAVRIVGDNWDLWFGRLRKYHKHHEGWKIPDSEFAGGLRKFAAKCRSDYQHGLLTSDRVTALESLSFPWTVNVESWEDVIASARDFIKTHGDIDQARSLAPHLHTSLTNMVRRARSGSVSAEAVVALQSLGFVVTNRDTDFKAKLVALDLYHEKTGRWIPRPQDKDGGDLFFWLRDMQRRMAGLSDRPLPGMWRTELLKRPPFQRATELAA